MRSATKRDQLTATANLSSQNPKIYAILKKMPNRILGGLLDSGAQRGATGLKSQHTGTSLLMQPAVGPAKHMFSILIGAETQDSHGKPFVLVVPDVSVYDLATSDSLIPVGRLIEAGVSVNHRVPFQANEGGFPSKPFRSTVAPSQRLMARQDTNCHGICPAHMASSPAI